MILRIPHRLRAPARLVLFPIRTMPTSTSKPSKLIFAPGEAPATPSDPAQNRPSRAAQFNVGTLRRSDLVSDPFIQFHAWFSDPRLVGTTPETVTLSTAELPSGRVSSRMVYLKELDSRGFVIYSNWGTSRKASDHETNTRASLCFWWKPLERQVRVEGVAERLTAAESQVYFDTRARGSRIGAWASQQTMVLRPAAAADKNPPSSEENKDDDDDDDDDDDGRRELEAHVRAVEARFAGVDKIPVPDFWGGLRVVPDMIEFWQGRDSRLHDRFRYSKEADAGSGGGEWKIERLSP